MVTHKRPTLGTKNTAVSNGHKNVSPGQHNTHELSGVQTHTRPTKSVNKTITDGKTDCHKQKRNYRLLKPPRHGPHRGKNLQNTFQGISPQQNCINLSFQPQNTTYARAKNVTTQSQRYTITTEPTSGLPLFSTIWLSAQPEAVPWTSIHIQEQTETPFIHILEQTETTQSESSHSKPTNDDKTAARRRLNMALILALVFAAASHLTQLSSSMILSLLQVIFVLFITLMGFQTVMDSLEPNFPLKLFLEPSESFEVSSWVSVLLSAHKVEPLLPSRLQALHWLPLQVADLWSCTPCSYSSLRYSAPWGPTWTCSYLPKCVAYTVFRSQCLSRSPSGVWASIDGGQPTQASSICVPDFAAKQSGFALP